MRNAVAVLLGIVMLGPTRAYAEGGGSPQLILPLMAAIAAVSAARGLPVQTGLGRAGGRGGFLGMLPNQLQIPDVYANLEQDFIDLHREVVPLDRDRRVWIELLRHRRAGWMPSFVYDEESRGPLAGSDDVLRIEIEYEF